METRQTGRYLSHEHLSCFRLRHEGSGPRYAYCWPTVVTHGDSTPRSVGISQGGHRFPSHADVGVTVGFGLRTTARRRRCAVNPWKASSNTGPFVLDLGSTWHPRYQTRTACHCHCKLYALNRRGVAYPIFTFVSSPKELSTLITFGPLETL